MSEQKRLTATGDITTRDAYLKSATVEGAVAVVLDLRQGGSAGTILCTLRVAAGATEMWTSGDKRGAYYKDGIHATLSAAGSASIEFE